MRPIAHSGISNNPIGENCLRNRIICEGYLDLAFHGARGREQRRSSNELQESRNNGGLQSLYPILDSGNNSNLFDEDLGFLFENVDPPFNNFEDELGQLSRFETLDDPNFESNHLDNALVSTNGSAGATMLSIQRNPPSTVLPSQSNGAKENFRFNSIPRNGRLNDLPFLLANVNTPAERRLFFHFTTLTSRVLTLSNGKNNPLTSIVVPLAAKDQTVMQSLLCLAGSHLVSISTDGNTQDVKLEKERLHALATRTQALRVQTLERPGCPRSSQELEAVLTSALLLCL